MRLHRSIEEQQLQQLKMINSQLNPAPALLKFSLFVVIVLFAVFGAFGCMLQLVRLGQ